MSEAKQNTKVLMHQKRTKRRWITFVRMIRYGINNFSRNAWLTIAATAVMTVTLLVVFMTMAARSTLLTTVDDIRSKVDMSIYLKTNVPDDARLSIMQAVEALPSVQRVSYVSPEEARRDFANQHKTNQSTLNALKEATNQFPGIVRINLDDINNTSELDQFVKTNTLYKQYAAPDREPSFAGERRQAIQSIGRWVSFADQAGLVASAVFVIISSLIVFNTIRMAIFNRKEEIQMMKLIGAERSFIRGPFIVEAIVYGFIAAILATGMGILALLGARDTLASYQVAIGPTIDFIYTYIGFVALSMIVLGAVIGVVSSLLATRRYLKL